MLECVRIALIHLMAVSLWKSTAVQILKDSNNPTVCLRFPQYVIRFTELWMAQC